ncbi:hypothetical protein [Solitalea lacus]|uniref:hypothetical protein n=1 Tax=Solitalea lacus TaxID=2911172 RepID=UPI001EDA5658|nr:hypothetical protein [Solitalea lacus]UKJ07279.1 hypothetical protein L2B55_17360 [Solitalea lacus]
MQFEEKQKFNQLWIALLIFSSVAMTLGLFLYQWKVMKNYQPALLAVIGFELFMVFLLHQLFTLKTLIDLEGIHFQFKPFHLRMKTINWYDIDQAYIRKYEPITEYGGWGIKGLWPFKSGRAYNVSGDIGLQIKLTNGKRILIGTNQAVEMQKVLNSIAKFKKLTNIIVVA